VLILPHFVTIANPGSYYREFMLQEIPAEYTFFWQGTLRSNVTRFTNDFLYRKRRNFGGTLADESRKFAKLKIRQLAIFILFSIGCTVNFSSANLLQKAIRRTKVPPNFRLLRLLFFVRLFCCLAIAIYTLPCRPTL